MSSAEIAKARERQWKALTVQEKVGCRRQSGGKLGNITDQMTHRDFAACQTSNNKIMESVLDIKYVSLVTRVESIYRTTKERNQHQPKLWYMYTQIPKRLSPRYDANMSNEKCKALGNQVASQSYAVIIGLESEKDRVQPRINAIPCQSI
jgi:hypothetical protein